MRYLLSFNEDFNVLKKYPKLPGESTRQYSTRIQRIKREEQEAWKPVGAPKQTNTEQKKSQILEIIPEIKTGDKKFDKEVEAVAKSYSENQQRLDPIMDEFFRELGIEKNQIFNQDGTLKDSEEILELLDQRGKESKNTERFAELSKRLMNLMTPVKNEEYVPIIEWSLGIIGILTVLAWMRGRSRLPVYQTASPKPEKWYQKAYYWLKSKGIDLSFGMDPNREHPLIVSDRPYGRTYGVNSTDPNDRVRTVLDPSLGPEKGGKPLVTGSGTQYGYRTSVG